jgi:phosphate transport system protein
MSKHFARDYAQIHQQLLELFAVVEKMAHDAVSAFCEHRFDLVREVMRGDAVVDRTEVAIEENCLKTLALYQPVAIELRRLTTMMKINSELERIADLTRHIAERAVAMRDGSPFNVPAMLPEMSRRAIRMVGRSLDSFVNLDTRLARDVVQQDGEVDRINREVIQQLVDQMKQDAGCIEPALNCFSVSKHLERIADHAVNIAEDVVYLVDGDIVRHSVSRPHGVSTNSSVQES